MPMQLSEAVVNFIEAGVSVVAASRAADNRPAVGRALAALASADRRRVILLIEPGACRSLLEAVAASGVVAAVFTQPTTHRSLQLKGAGAEIRPAKADERPLIVRHKRAFDQELRDVGYGEAFVATFTPANPDEVVAITFTPAAAFDQTPGPQAGGAVPA